jgi:hypothetical protein
MEVIVTSDERLKELINEAVKGAISAYSNLSNGKSSKEFYTEKELRTLLGIKSRSTINSYERKGLLKPIILQRVKKYSAKDIEVAMFQSKLQNRG